MAVKLMFLQTVVCTLSAISLLWKGIGRSNRWLLAYLGVEAVLGIPGALLYHDINAYGWFYYCSAAFSWFTPLGAAIEGYSHVMHNHPGIERLGRRVLYRALFIGPLLSLLAISAQTTVTQNATDLFRVASSIEAVVRTALLIFWILLIAFIIWYPVSLSRNTVIFSLLFGIYFLGTTVAILLQAGASDSFVIRRVGLARGVFVVLFQCAWGILLTCAGEQNMVRIGHRWNPAEEGKLLAQLDAINEHLIASTRAR